MMADAMQERLEARLAALKDEFARGRERLDRIEAEANTLRETMLRISGAIQVLTEALEGDAPSPDPAGAP